MKKSLPITSKMVIFHYELIKLANGHLTLARTGSKWYGRRIKRLIRKLEKYGKKHNLIPKYTTPENSPYVYAPYIPRYTMSEEYKQIVRNRN